MHVLPCSDSVESSGREFRRTSEAMTSLSREVEAFQTPGMYNLISFAKSTCQTWNGKWRKENAGKSMSKSGTSPISMSISSLKLLLAKKDLPSGKLLLYIDMVLYYYIIESHSYGKSQSVSPPSSKNRETPVKLLGSATPSIGFLGSATGKLFCLTGVLWDSMVFHGVFEWAKRFSCLIFFHSVA